MKWKRAKRAAGRKVASESRADELCAKLLEWNRTPRDQRVSLRTLAIELDTSHQLLSFHLKRLGKWQIKEYWRQAKEIRARAYAEGRPLSQLEEQFARGYERLAIRATFDPILRDQIKSMREASEHGPLCWQQVKTLKLLARGGFREAQELLQKCSQRLPTNQKNNLPPIPDDTVKSFKTA